MLDIKIIFNLIFNLKSLKDIKEDKVIFKRKDPYKLIVTLQTQVTKVRFF